MMNPSFAIFLLTIGIVSAGPWHAFDFGGPKPEWKCTNTAGQSMNIDIANGKDRTLNNAQLDQLYEQGFMQMEISEVNKPCYDYMEYVSVTGNENSWTCKNIETNEKLKGVNKNHAKARKADDMKYVEPESNHGYRKGEGPGQPKTTNACMEQRRQRKSKVILR